MKVGKHVVTILTEQICQQVVTTRNRYLYIIALKDIALFLDITCARGLIL